MSERPLLTAGWFQDPDDPAKLRWWDGEEWGWPRMNNPTPSVPAYPNTPSSLTAQGPEYIKAWSPQPLRPPSIGILVLGIGFILLALAGIGLSVSGLSRLSKPGLGESFYSTYAALRNGYRPVGVLYTLGNLFILLPLGIISLIWFHRAYQNLLYRGFHLRFSPGWAVGAWFIPFFNWVRPKSIANDLWRADLSDLPVSAVTPETTREQRIGISLTWTQVKSNALLHIWWACYLLGGTLVGAGAGLISGSYGAGNDYISGKQMSVPDPHLLLSLGRIGFIALIVGWAVWIASAVLYLIIVQRVSEVQDERRRQKLPV